MTKRRLHIYFNWNKSFPDGFSHPTLTVKEAKKENRSYILFIMHTGGIQVRVQRSLYDSVLFNTILLSTKIKLLLMH